MEEAKLNTDGGSRGNPGPSATAYVICKMDGTVVEKTGKYLGVTTNNQAEYRALLDGLERALELGVKRLHVFMDSELIVKQVQGVYKVKNPELKPHHETAKSLIAKFESVTIQHVPRELNKEADGEVNHILDNQDKL